MKQILSTIIAIALLLGLGALAVLARGGGDALTPVKVAPVALAAAQPQTAAAPDAPTATSGINWITIPLTNASLVNASDLATDIETGTGSTVDTIGQWNPGAQNYTTYLHADNIGNFPLLVGGAYQVTAVGGGSSLTWSLVGNVPDASQFTYILYQTASGAINWIMLPLDKGAVTKASELAADIGAHSSGAVTVDTVEQWNATSQNYLTYIHSDNIGEFPVKIGYPYRVTISATSGSVTWPVR